MCGQAVLAGSSADLRFAADLTALAALDELGAGVLWNNLLWVLEPWAGAAAPIDVPYGVLRQSQARHPQCTTCQAPRVHEIAIPPDVLAALRVLAEAKPGTETGGALIGYEENGVVYVVEATAAGPNAVEEPTRFVYDAMYINERLRDAATRLGDRGKYVGEWHSHPEADPQPSPRDIRSFN